MDRTIGGRLVRGSSGSNPVFGKSGIGLRTRLYLALLTIDLLSIMMGMFAASWAYFGNTFNYDWIWMTGALIPLYIGAAISGRAYSVRVVQETGTGITAAVQALMIAIGLLLLIAFLLKVGPEFSRMTLVLGSFACIFTVSAARTWFLRHSHRLLGGSAYSVILIQDGPVAAPMVGASIVLSADTLPDPGLQRPETYNSLATALAGGDRVVVACPETRRLAWTQALRGANILGEVLVPEMATLAPLGTGSWASLPTLIVSVGPLGTADRALKRGFDIVASLVALAVLSPVFVTVAIAIRIDSPGPVFFVQTRLGHGNRIFRMIKFRSMCADAPDSAGRQSTRRDDDRITRIGAFIRRTSIDELPQLLNVLRGEMSIVGPRPHALGSRAADKLFWEIDPNYWHRHAAKPGLTGLAQVRGFRGATTLESDLTDRLQADLEYLTGWSLWRDLLIISLTFRVLIHRNAF